MAMFFYRAYGPQGELAEGQIEAASEEAVGEMLWARKLVAFEIRNADAAQIPWWKREVTFSSAAFSQSQLAAFTREFATLASAGVPLPEALRIMLDHAPTVRARGVIERLLDEVLNGASLSSAMEKHAGTFSGEYTSVIRAAEMNGNHAQAFEELAQLLEQRAELAARVQSALIYPSILIVLSFASLAVITGVLVPNIAPIFAGSGVEPPGAVAFLMMLYENWQGILIGLAVFAAIFAGAFSIARRTPEMHAALERGKLNTPLFGPLLLKRDTARFARTCGTLLRAGVPLLAAGNSAAAVIRNGALQASVRGAIDQLREGVSLHKALSEGTPLPATALRMIAVGEQAADLGQMLLRVAVIFEQQTQRSLDRLTTLLTPAITLFVAILVGLLIVTIMNAVLSINDLAVA